MSFHVNLSVIFPCYANDKVAELAKRYLDSFGVELPPEGEWPKHDYTKEYLYDSWYAMCFLTNLARRTGINAGPRGGMSLWGTVGNHVNVDMFVDELYEFWRDLLIEDNEGPLSHEHILVFYEYEQSFAANCIEIFLQERRRKTSKVVIEHHKDLPFRWNQH